jgi:hypothetical protein
VPRPSGVTERAIADDYPLRQPRCFVPDGSRHTVMAAFGYTFPFVFGNLLQVHNYDTFRHGRCGSRNIGSIL